LNAKKQIILNLERSIDQLVPLESRVMAHELFAAAACAVSMPSINTCTKCDHTILCSRLMQWNDCTPKEFLRKG